MRFPKRQFARLAVQRNAQLRCAIACLTLAMVSGVSTNYVFAQSGLRESLERLDINENGRIDPEEVTPLARPYLERISEGRRLSLDRANEIAEFQEAARIYHAMRSGIVGQPVESQTASQLREFGVDADEPIVPEFGIGEVKYSYIQADLDEADATLRRYDRNRDGHIDRTEAATARWTHSDPFEADVDKDDRVSRMEFVQRYARRRLISNATNELVKKTRRVGNGIDRSLPTPSPEPESRGWWRRGGSETWLTASLLGRFDANRDGKLEMNESKEIGLPFGVIDIDRNGELSRDELQTYLTELQDEAGAEVAGIPGWFYELDADRDGQVAMAEFTEEWTAEKFNEFTNFDLNEDGLLTARELMQSRAVMGGSFSCQRVEVLPPQKTVISEIEIDEDFIIDDVNLQLSITHTNTGSLDAYLTGPDGQRIELFSDVGGSGDHFDKTIFDDSADIPIIKAQAPFVGRFLTEARIRNEPSLSHFSGKNARGVWQLIIRGTRSDRFGMLHEWSLAFKSKEDLYSDRQGAAVSVNDAQTTTSTDGKLDSQK
jgi:Ca2+-binding EF-hand superfamily protein/subtilisin-like proprotein convertase family protein